MDVMKLIITFKFPSSSSDVLPPPRELDLDIEAPADIILTNLDCWRFSDSFFAKAAFSLAI